MFCEKCGKPNDDDALFCEFCGAGFNDPAAGGQAAPAQTPVQAPVQTPVQAPAPAPVYAAAAAPKKHSKARVIAAAIALVVFMAWCVYLIFFLNKKPAKTDSYGGGVVAGNSGTSAPAQTGKPTMTGNPAMTVNGNNLHVDFAVLDNYRSVVIASKTDDEIFGVRVRFLNGLPQSNTTINSPDSSIKLEFLYAGKNHPLHDTYMGSDTGNYGLIHVDADEYSVEIGEVVFEDDVPDDVPNEYIEIKISGKVKIYNDADDFETYDFEAGGKLNYTDGYNYPGEAFTEWLNNNPVPISE